MDKLSSFYRKRLKSPNEASCSYTKPTYTKPAKKQRHSTRTNTPEFCVYDFDAPAKPKTSAYPKTPAKPKTPMPRRCYETLKKMTDIVEELATDAEEDSDSESEKSDQDDDNFDKRQ